MSTNVNNHVIGGLKATVHNETLSDETRQNASERLATMGINEPFASENSEHLNRQLGGYKATLSNPNTSEEAKAHAREILEAHDGSGDRNAQHSDDEHQTRVLAGYKAALSNPRVSAAAKAHAEQVLREHGAL